MAKTEDESNSPMSSFPREELVVRALQVLNSPSANGESIRDLVSLVGDLTGIEAVGIRLRDREDFPYCETKGFTSPFVCSERTLCRRGEDDRVERDAEGRAVLECMCGAVIRGRAPSSCSSPNGSFWTNSTTELLGSDLITEFPPHMRNRCHEEGYESMALIPVRHKVETIGLLQLNDSRTNLYDRETIAFFEGLSAGIGLALAGKLTSADAQGADSRDTNPGRAQDILRIQRDLAQSLGEATDLAEALSRCVSTAVEATDFDCGGAYVVDRGTGNLNLACSQGLGEAFVESGSQLEADSPSVELVMAGEPQYRGHLTLGIEIDDERAAEGLRAMAVLPVSHEGSVVACMNLASHTADEISVTDRLVAESIAAQMGSIISLLATVDTLRESEERKSQYVSGLALLASSAIGFLELPHHADVYDFIAEQVSELVADSPIVVASYSAASRRFEIRALRNLDSQLEALNTLVGRDIRGLEIQLHDDTANQLVAGGLVRISRKAFDSSCSAVSSSNAAVLDEEIRAKEVQAIGLVRGGELFGALGFVVRQGDAAIAAALVEAFAGQASVALGRRRIEHDKSDLEEQQFHAQKMEAIGTLAAGIAHDFNNLLTGVLGHAYMLKGRQEPGTAVFKSAETIETAALRASELTKQLLGFARRGKLQDLPLDIHQLVDDVVFFLEHTVDKRIDLIRETCSGTAQVSGDPSQLQAVILNLAVNARDAMPDGGKLRFVTERTRIVDHRSGISDFVPGRYLRLSIKDTGQGIPDEIKGRIFEPFFTTKEIGKGTGMGLAMVYGVVRDHGGWIDVESQVGVGTTFDLYLPLRTIKGVDQPPTGHTEKLVRGGGCVLVVDDELTLRKMFRRLLEKLGYEVICVANGELALEAYRERQAEIDVVLLDLVMPVMNGSTCFRGLKELDPDVRVIITTGRAIDETADKMLRDGAVAFVEKPVLPAQLSQVLADVLGVATDQT
ncbi:MAG: response regulator [Deltaproteobacteria bacterium]|nr:response regulator [Deltaproteobacteria bacterium]